MKFAMFTLVLACGLSNAAPAFAQTDKKLMAALENLAHRAEVSRNTYMNEARQLSKTGIYAGIAIGVADALRADKNVAAVLKAPRFGAAIFLAGVAAYTVLGLQQYVAIPQRMHDPHVVENAVDLSFFFARPLFEQYEIAKDNPRLYKVIMKMNRDYEEIDNALRKYKRPTPQIKNSADQFLDSTR